MIMNCRLTLLTIIASFAVAANAIDDKLVVLGGFADKLTANVEVVDLAKDPQTCDDLPDLPMPIEGFMAAYLRGEIRWCGGTIDSVNKIARKACFVMRDGQWMSDGEMLEPRIFAGSVTGMDNWYLIGGSDNGTYTNSSEVYKNGVFSPWIDIPEPLDDQCVIHVRPETLFMAGGRTTGGVFSKKAHLLSSLATATEWAGLPDMSQAHEAPFCAAVPARGGGSDVELVVAGGRILGGEATDLVEIYSLETGQWRIGTSLPDKMAFLYSADTMNPSSAQFQVGGFSPDKGNFDTIRRFEGAIRGAGSSGPIQPGIVYLGSRVKRLRCRPGRPPNSL